MKRSHLIGGILTAAALATAGVGVDALLAGPPAPAAVASPAPAAMSRAQVGTTALAPGTALVDAGGRALYLFEADRGTTSMCNGVCAQIWPPLLDDGTAPVAAGEVQASLFGSTTRADGTQQVTYNGHPLYSFTGDKNPGETRGQGIDRFGGLWYVVDPAGDEIGSGHAPVAPAAPAGTNGAYGY